MEAVWAFRKKAELDAALGDEIQAAMKSSFSLATVAAVARRNGFNVTDEEIVKGWEQASCGELTALELELVSAGSIASTSNYNSTVNSGSNG
jgi:hypothetical protein